jgi:enoyl-CoA hydratase/carnithine racemase
MRQSNQDYDFQITLDNRVAVVEFHDHPRHSIWSMPRMSQLTSLLTSLNDDDAVNAVVLFSGAGRSFGVGGSFHETSTFRGGDEVDEWIDHITDLYLSALLLDRPLIAAIDGWAIGIGLQIALTADYRIGSTECVLKMPEFELGIACTFGGYMLERTVGRAVMQNMLMTCEEWPAERAKADHLLHEVVPPSELLDSAMRRARFAAGFSPPGFRRTKPFVNAEYIAGLERTRVAGKEAHRAAFAAGDAQHTMRRVIGKA